MSRGDRLARGLLGPRRGGATRRRPRLPGGRRAGRRAAPLPLERLEAPFELGDALLERIESAHPPLELVETLPVFTAGLLEAGYSEEQVAKILGGNALRVLRQVLPA